jgi:uncharacterized protein
MKAIFADAHFFLAVMNDRDQAHRKAMAFSQGNNQPILTTAWVLTEVADGLARGANRNGFQQLLDDLYSDAESTIVPADQATWEKGVALYNQRPDKKWSLTDCISFVVMQERGLTEALTADRHFEQAGFTILLG